MKKLFLMLTMGAFFCWCCANTSCPAEADAAVRTGTNICGYSAVCHGRYCNNKSNRYVPITGPMFPGRRSDYYNCNGRRDYYSHRPHRNSPYHSHHHRR